MSFVTEPVGAVFGYIGVCTRLGIFEVATRSKDTIFRFSLFVFRVILELERSIFVFFFSFYH